MTSDDTWNKKRAVRVREKSFLERFEEFRHGYSYRYRDRHIDFWRVNIRDPVFIGQTISGFTIQYRLTVFVTREDNAEFTKERMLEEDNLVRLEHDINETFLQWMKESDRHFFVKGLWGSGGIIRADESGDIVDEISCSKTAKAFTKLDYRKYGCRVELVLCDVRIDTTNEATFLENLRMIDENTTRHLEERFQAYKLEEAWTLICLREWMKTRDAWGEQMRISSNRTYAGKWIEVQTESEGNEVVLRWNYKKNAESARFHLRGFRKEDGFSLADDDASQGTLIVDRWGPDWKSERVELGKTYFYTFKVSFLHSKTGSEVVQERLRFEITTPSEGHLADLGQKFAIWADRMDAEKTPPSDPRRDKVNRAIEELSAFVEFDESLTQWEKSLVQQIESKGYPAKERKDKIERLKLAVESLRLERL